MKATVNSQNGKMGVVNLPFYPTKESFNRYKEMYPNSLIEVKLVNSGSVAMIRLGSLSFISKMDLGIPKKSDWDF